MLASLPDELTKDLAGVRIDGDPVSFVDDNDQASVIVAQRGEHCGQDDREGRRQIGRIGQGEIPKTDRNWSGADTKGGWAVEDLCPMTLSETSQPRSDDPTAILLSPCQRVHC